MVKLRKILETFYEFMWNNSLSKRFVITKEDCISTLETSVETINKDKKSVQPLTVRQVLYICLSLVLLVLPVLIIVSYSSLFIDLYDVLGLEKIDAIGFIIFTFTFVFSLFEVGISYILNSVENLTNIREGDAKDDGIN